LFVTLIVILMNSDVKSTSENLHVKCPNILSLLVFDVSDFLNKLFHKSLTLFICGKKLISHPTKGVFIAF